MLCNTCSRLGSHFCFRSTFIPGSHLGWVGESITEKTLDYAADTDGGSELDSESNDLDADDDLDGDAAIFKADGLFNDRMSRRMQRHADKTARMELSAAMQLLVLCAGTL